MQSLGFTTLAGTAGSSCTIVGESTGDDGQTVCSLTPLRLLEPLWLLQTVANRLILTGGVAGTSSMSYVSSELRNL